MSLMSRGSELEAIFSSLPTLWPLNISLCKDAPYYPKVTKCPSLNSLRVKLSPSGWEKWDSDGPFTLGTEIGYDIVITLIREMNRSSWIQNIKVAFECSIFGI